MYPKRDDQTPTTVTPSTFPSYASACSSFAKYSSACSCLGVTGTATTLDAPAFTVHSQTFALQVVSSASLFNGRYVLAVGSFSLSGYNEFTYRATTLSAATKFKLVGDVLNVADVNAAVGSAPNGASFILALSAGGTSASFPPMHCSITGGFLTCYEAGNSARNVFYDEGGSWTIDSVGQTVSTVTLKVVAAP